MKKSILIFLLLVQFIFAKHIPFINYNTTNGLFQATAYYIFQDHYGFLWVATQYGTFKFDGVEFINFNKNSGLIGNKVISIAEDPFYNNMYFATIVGLSVLKNGKFYNYNSDNSILKADYINSVFYDKLNRRVLCGTNLGLYFIKDTVIENYYIKKNGLLNDTVLLITSDTTGKIYIVYPNGIGILDKGNISNYPIEGHRLNGIYINGDIWVYGEDGIFLFNKGKYFPFLQRFFSKYTIKSMLKDMTGGFWVGVSSALGVFYYKNGILTRYGSNNGFSNVNVEYIFEDREYNLWFCTNGAYIYRLSKMMFSYYNEYDGLDSKIVWCISKYKDNILVGTEKGLNILKKGEFYKNKLCRMIDKEKPILSILYDSIEKKLYIVSFGAGLWVYDENKDKIVNYNNKNSNISNYLRYLYRDKKGNIWICSRNGLFKLQKYGILKFSKENGLWMDDIFNIIQVSDDEYFLGAGNGLIRMKDNVFYQYSSDTMFNNISILDFLRIDKNTLLFATDNGIFKYNLQENKVIEHYNVQNGLSNNTCYFMVEDDIGRLWVGTNRGLDVIEEGNIKNYSLNDGLPAEEFNQNAFYKDSKNDRLYFGNIGGLVEYNREFDVPVYNAPEVYIKKFMVFDSIYPIDKKVKLKYKQNFILIEYIGLDYLYPDKVQYRFRLKGLYDTYRTTKERKVQFAYLPPGSYVFEIYAVSNDGVESKNSAFIEFEITPPFWETTLFYVLIGSTIIIVILIWFSRLKIQTKRLEELVEERTRELRQKNEALIIEKQKLEVTKSKLIILNKKLDKVSRKDPLTGLSNRRDLMEKLDYEVKRALRVRIPLSFLMGDIDFFKKINDNYGHKAGDFVLKEISKIFVNSLRDIDIISRWGGEEFLIILPNTDLAGAKLVAEKIRKFVEQHDFIFENKVIKVTISFGVSTFREKYSVDDFIKFADKSLYKAKQSGRNKVIASDIKEI